MTLIGSLALASCQAATLTSFDAEKLAEPSLLISDARVIDGTGATARQASVRIVGDRIAEIGDLTPAPGEQVVDATGMILAPGFIDTHSHHDIGLLEGKPADALLAQGVTTIIAGQDGLSQVPISTFFAAFEDRPVAVNVAAYAGHNAIRREVLGSDGDRLATPAEMERMEALLARDMMAGALGLSTGLEYDPGRSSDPDEVLRLARVAARYGGRYISHIRSEDRDLWSAVDELIDIARKTGMPVQLSHAKLAMRDLWGQAPALVAKLDAARLEGIEISADVYPYTFWQSFISTLWPDRDFSDRSKAEYALSELTSADQVMIVHYPLDPSLEGRFLADIAEARGEDPVTTLIALAEADDAAQTRGRLVATGMAEEDVAALLAWPHSNVASDGMLGDPHPRGAGAFARIVRVFVTDEGLLTLEEAVRKMSALSAHHVGISDRGRIAVGAMADLVLFNSNAFADRATRLDPGQLATGVSRVWVNGQLVFSDGKATDANPGRVLRREVEP